MIRGDKHLGSDLTRAGSVVISITRRGTRLAAQIAKALNCEAICPERFTAELGIDYGYTDSVINEIRRQWAKDKQHLVLVMPTGVATRAIAPLLKNKRSDPAVVCLDESGAFVIPLIGGHVAGANRLATQVAELTGGAAAITTASDRQGKPALDLLGRESGWKVMSGAGLTHASAALVNGELIGLFVDPAIQNQVKDEIQDLMACDNVRLVQSLDELDVDEYTAGVIISHRQLSDHHRHVGRKSALVRPAVLVAGIGCKRGVAKDVLAEALRETMADNDLAMDSLVCLATAEIKKDELGLIELAQDLDLPLKIVAETALAALDPAGFSPSAAQAKFGIAGVAEPCALLVSQGELLVPKQAFDVCTVAIAQIAI